MSFSEWLQGWVGRHPVKTPPTDPAAFTGEVMRRLAEPPPTRSWARPQLAWGAALAAAAVVLALRLPAPPTAGPGGGAGRLTASIQQDAEVLAALGEPIEDELSEEVFAAFLLAEAPPDDEAWLAETMALLESLDESLPEADASDDDEWLRELESLEAAGTSTTS